MNLQYKLPVYVVLNTQDQPVEYTLFMDYNEAQKVSKQHTGSRIVNDVFATKKGIKLKEFIKR